MFWSKDTEIWEGWEFFSLGKFHQTKSKDAFDILSKTGDTYSNLTADVLHYRAQVVLKYVFLPGPVGIWSNNFYYLLTQILSVCDASSEWNCVQN